MSKSFYLFKESKNIKLFVCKKFFNNVMFSRKVQVYYRLSLWFIYDKTNIAFKIACKFNFKFNANLKQDCLSSSE